MSVIIPRNSSIPIEKTERYHTAHDNQTGYHIYILQGEFPDAADNHQVAFMEIKDIQRSPAG